MGLLYTSIGLFLFFHTPNTISRDISSYKSTTKIVAWWKSPWWVSFTQIWVSLMGLFHWSLLQVSFAHLWCYRSLFTHNSFNRAGRFVVKTENRFGSLYFSLDGSLVKVFFTHIYVSFTHTQVSFHTYTPDERWGAGVETQKNVRGEIGGWGRVPFNEPYAPSWSTIYDGA